MTGEDVKRVNLTPTYLTRLLAEILSNCPSIVSLTSHYLSDGIKLAFLNRYDGQEWEMVIRKRVEK